MIIGKGAIINYSVMLVYVVTVGNMYLQQRYEYLEKQVTLGLSKRFQFLTPIPTEVTIECTTKCDLECIMCLRSYRQAMPNRDMTLEEFEHVINQFPHLKRVNLTGQGENLLNDNFFEIVKRLKSRSVFVGFYDNFKLVSPETAKKIISSKIDRITISLDAATPEKYEEIRKGAKFEQVVNNIENFIALKTRTQSKNPYLAINVVVIKENVHELPALVQLASSLGIKFVTFTKGFDFNLDEIGNLSVLSVPSEERTRIFNETMKMSKSLHIDINFEEFSKMPIKACPYPFRSCLVRCDGSIYPCYYNGYIKLPSFGNIYKDEFKKIWRSKRFAEVRNSIRKGKVARYCVGCTKYL